VSHTVWADTSENWQSGQSTFAIAEEGASLLGINRQAAEFSDSAGAAQHNDQVMNPASALSLTPSSRDSQPRRQKGSASTLEPSRSPSSGSQPGVFLGYEHASNDLFAVDDFQWIVDNEGGDYLASVDNLFLINRQVSQDAVAVPAQEHTLEAPTEHVKRTKAKRRRLDADQKQKVKRVRRLGACLRCRIYREPVRNSPTPNFKLIGCQCDENTPCGSCTRRAASATLFKQPCYRESLDNVVAFRLGRSCSNIDLRVYTPLNRLADKDIRKFNSRPDTSGLSETELVRRGCQSKEDPVDICTCSSGNFSGSRIGVSQVPPRSKRYYQPGLDFKRREERIDPPSLRSRKSRYPTVLQLS
jgi:hypothetical protein